MNLWRMEWARLFRTRRWIGLLAGYLFFGLLGPLVTRYQKELLRSIGGGIKIVVPEPTAAQAVDSYVKNASQIGLLVAVALAAGALALDARPEWAAFLRTRVTSVARLLVPRYVVSVAGAGAAFALGVIAAWYETAVLIAGPPVGAMLAGAVYGVVYLGFAVGVVAVWAGVSRSTIAAIALSMITLAVVPLLAIFRVLEPWLPSYLVGAMTSMTAGTAWTEFLRAAAVALVASGALLWAGARLSARREL